MKIIVTSPCYDDIAQILNLLNLDYSNYQGKIDCDIFFLNCGTSDKVDGKKLNQFVKNGGILYASDLTSTFIAQTFPNLFNFEGDIGQTGTITATVCDEELKGIIGTETEIFFDLGSWSVLNSIKNGKIILKSKSNKKPIMVEVPFGKGKIFYTCFHNHTQANEKETILLRLLILKQIGQFKQTTIEQVSDEMNINLSDYKKHFVGDFLNPDNNSYEIDNSKIEEKSEENNSWDKLTINQSTNTANTEDTSNKKMWDKF